MSKPSPEDIEYTPPVEGSYPTIPIRPPIPEKGIHQNSNVQLASILADTDKNKLKELSRIPKSAVRSLARSHVRSVYIKNIGIQAPIDLREEKTNAYLLYNRSVNADWADRILMMSKYEQEKHEVTSMDDDLD